MANMGKEELKRKSEKDREEIERKEYKGKKKRREETNLKNPGIITYIKT